MATLAVEFRNKMDMVIAVDVRDHFKSISPAVLANYIIHDRALKPTTSPLHERFYTEIIEPFHAFHKFLRREVKGKDLDWVSFVGTVARFFTSQNKQCKLDALAAEHFGRIVCNLTDWQAKCLEPV
jgi:hypothetical protein